MLWAALRKAAPSQSAFLPSLRALVLVPGEQPGHGPGVYLCAWETFLC